MCHHLCVAAGSAGGFDSDIYGSSKPEVTELRTVEEIEAEETGSRDFTMVIMLP